MVNQTGMVRHLLVAVGAHVLLEALKAEDFGLDDVLDVIVGLPYLFHRICSNRWSLLLSNLY